VHLKGQIHGAVALQCHRCLEPYLLEVETTFSYVLVPRDAEEAEDEGIDVEISAYDDDVIDLGGVFREQLLLQLPMRYICREECKGLCPGCGADLNIEECRCEPLPKDSPFAVLRGLKGTGA
jgi:uncharacterized protein